ncbi:hypothetical protein NUSPORA_02456 [Nucleospora cyclopteri]
MNGVEQKKKLKKINKEQKRLKRRLIKNKKIKKKINKEQKRLKKQRKRKNKKENPFFLQINIFNQMSLRQRNSVWVSFPSTILMYS